MSPSKSILNIIIGIALIVLGLIVRPIAAFNAFIPFWIGEISLGIGFIAIGISGLGWRKIAYVPGVISVAGCIYMIYEMVMFFVRSSI